MSDLDNTLTSIGALVASHQDQKSDQMKNLLNSMTKDVGIIQYNYQQIKWFLKDNLSDKDFNYLASHMQSIQDNTAEISASIPCAGSTKDLSDLIGTTNVYTGYISLSLENIKG